MQERCLGPTKVVLQDGKVVFVRHGSVVVRVSTSRLQPAGNTHVIRDSNLQNDQGIKHETQEQGGCDHGDSQGKRLEGTKPEGSRVCLWMSWASSLVRTQSLRFMLRAMVKLGWTQETCWTQET